MGIAAKKNRTAASANGGTASSAQRMGTKLKPQTAAIATRRTTSRGRTPEG
jgi:hypothetical protein